MLFVVVYIWFVCGCSQSISVLGWLHPTSHVHATFMTCQHISYQDFPRASGHLAAQRGLGSRWSLSLVHSSLEMTMWSQRGVCDTNLLQLSLCQCSSYCVEYIESTMLIGSESWRTEFWLMPTCMSSNLCWISVPHRILTAIMDKCLEADLILLST